jgi:hypothetical protein
MVKLRYVGNNIYEIEYRPGYRGKKKVFRPPNASYRYTDDLTIKFTVEGEEKLHSMLRILGIAAELDLITNGEVMDCNKGFSEDMESVKNEAEKSYLSGRRYLKNLLGKHYVFPIHLSNKWVARRISRNIKKDTGLTGIGDEIIRYVKRYRYHLQSKKPEEFIQITT